MAKTSTSQTRQPGGRNLSTMEIICVCIILLVGFVVVKNAGRKAPSSDASAPAQARGEVPPVETPVVPGRPSTRAFQQRSFDAFADSTYAADPLSIEIEPLVLEQLVAESDAIVSAVDTGTGTVAVVYTDGSTATFTAAEVAEEAHISLVRNGSVTQLKYTGLFRAPVDDLKPASASLNNQDRDESVSTVQLERYKQLVASGQGTSRDARKAADNLVPEEIPLAIGAVDELPWSPEARLLTQDMMSRWGKEDPMAALAHAESYQSLRKRTEAVNSVLASFAKTDPEGALNWYFSNLETDPRAKSFSPAQVFRELAAEDFQGAVNRVNQIEDPTVRRTSLRYMLSSVEGAQRYQTIENLYHQSGTLDDRQMLAQEYVSDMSRYQPYDAANWIATLDQPEVQAKAIDTLVASWSADRPDQAAEWVLRLADPQLREKQLASISRNWARYDPVAAESWLGSFPPSPDMDTAVSGYVSTLRHDDPVQASEWVNKIYDPTKRVSATRAVAKDWVQKDPVGAREYILRAEMDDKSREKYLSIANRAIEVQQQLQGLN